MTILKYAPMWLISFCYLANTFSVYDADYGGTNIFFGNFGYHIEESK